MNKDWPMCERCEKEVKTVTIDIWVQGMSYDPNVAPQDQTPKSFEVEGRDYITLCEPCWGIVRETTWAKLCEATTIDAIEAEWKKKFRGKKTPRKPNGDADYFQMEVDLGYSDVADRR